MATLADEARDRAFERLYEGHVRDVYRYVLAVLRNPADAEDVTQTTFMNAYRAFKAGERPRKPQNWLITIAHNACRTRAVRASRRPSEVPLDDVVAQLALPEQEKPNVRELLRALGRLPFNQRAAIAMRELEGRSYDEIADTLGVSVPAVEALLVRARRTLRVNGAALRGLAVVQLPRSLRGMFEHGDVATAGGAVVGGGVLVKAAAVVVASVVAGGVGYKTVEAGIRHRAHHAPRLEPRPHSSPPTGGSAALGADTVGLSAHRSGSAPLVSARATARGARPVGDPGPGVGSPPSATAGSVSAGSASGAPIAGEASSTPPALVAAGGHGVRRGRHGGGGAGGPVLQQPDPAGLPPLPSSPAPAPSLPGTPSPGGAAPIPDVPAVVALDPLPAPAIPLPPVPAVPTPSRVSPPALPSPPAPVP